MRISIDLDDTLVFKTVTGPVDDSLPPLTRTYTNEKLRAGTRELIRALAQRGHEIWIYSNSYRGKTELLRWFQACELPVTDVVNQQLHELKRAELGPQVSGPIKFPPWFGIDVHIDDSVEIEADGHQYGFKVIRVDPNDVDWVATVLAALDAIEKAR